MRKFFKYLIILAVLISALGVIGYFLARKYEPEVKVAVVNEINRYLAVPVDVDDINLSLLQRFPYASLRFSNVVIPETNSEDTLIYIKDLYLQIGLLDFLRKNYTVSEAEINTGFFQMEFFPGGGDNFHFWKSSSKEGSSELSLSDIALHDFSYTLKTAEGLDLSITVIEGYANGDFGKEIFDIQTDSEIKIKKIAYLDQSLYSDILVDGDIKLSINNTAGTYLFSSDELEIAEESFLLKGSYIDSDISKWIVDFSTEAIDLENALKLVPENSQAIFRQYEPRGEADLNVKIVSEKNFNLEVAFDNLEGSFTNFEAAGRALVERASGKVTLKDEVASLFLKDLEASIGAGDFTAAGSVVDFSAPEFDLRLDGEIQLNELKKLLNITFVEILEGSLQLEGNLEGKLSSTEAETAEILRGIQFNGQIVLTEGKFKLDGRNEVFEEIRGDFEIRNNALITKKLQAAVGTNEFQLEGIMENALPFLTGKDERVDITAKFESKKIDLNTVLSGTSGSQEYHFELPENIRFDFSILIDELVFRQFRAEKVRGRAKYQSKFLTLNPFSMNLSSGKVASAVRVAESRNGYILSADAKLDNIDISKLFYAFENFDQEVIKSNHIEGLVDATAEFRGSFDSTLTFDPSSILAHVELVVSEGRLKKLEALRSVSDYIRSNVLWNSLIRVNALESRLNNIEFERLNNTFTIADKKITIPKMEISNSALTINVSGTHSFENTIDYSLSFRLSELLQTGRQKESEFGYVVDDQTGLNIFMKMEGTVDNPIFSTDQEAARESRKEKLQTEKKTIRNILKEEFGLFKSDTTLTGIDQDNEKHAPRFEVQWGDETKVDSTSANQKGKKAKKKKLSPGDKKAYEELESDDDL